MVQNCLFSQIDIQEFHLFEGMEDPKIKNKLFSCDMLQKCLP